MLGRYVERHFRAMGSRAHMVIRGTTADAEWAEHEVARLEQRWSRFVPESDVARANRAAGRDAVTVAPESLALVAEACAWWARTDGWFDPTVLHALEAHGYDATITAVQARPRTTPVLRSAPPDRAELRVPAVAGPVATAPAPGCAGITCDPVASTVRLPAGTALDLGGIGKGTAADRVATGLRARGVSSACVSLGGDVRAFGTGNHRDGWAVPVEDPLDEDRVLFTHVVTDGAIVTSTDRFRRWHHAGREHHHLIDPTTGRPAETGLAAVVVADTACARAEVLTKAAFVAGTERGTDLLARWGRHVGRDAWFVPAPATVAPAPCGAVR